MTIDEAVTLAVDVLMACDIDPYFYGTQDGIGVVKTAKLEVRIKPQELEGLVEDLDGS